MVQEFDTIQSKRGKLSDWTFLNPILEAGEIGIIFNSETGEPIGLKAGDGKTAFNNLQFLATAQDIGYTKEEVDELLANISNKLEVLQTTSNSILDLISPTATKTNKLVTLEDVEKVALLPNEEQLEALNSGITAELVQKLINFPTKTSDLENDGNGSSPFATEAELSNKLNKLQSPSANQYAYVSNEESNGILVKISESSEVSTIAKRTSDGTLQIQAGKTEYDAINKGQFDTVSNSLNSHLENFSNPHNVTIDQIGAEQKGSVKAHNSSPDAHKELFDKKQNSIQGDASQQTLLGAPSVNGGDPSRIAQSVFAKSTNLQSEVDARKAADADLNLRKVDKVEGKGLSANDLTDSLKEAYDDTVTKVEGIESGAQVNTIESIKLNGKVLVPNVKEVDLGSIPTDKNFSELDLKVSNEIIRATAAEKANQTAITEEAKTARAAEKVNSDAISSINEKIPTQANKTNQLADKSFVNSSINNLAAFYITKDAAGNPFNTYAELSSATTFYSGGITRVPTRNDYCIVLKDETKNNACTRYSYQGIQWQYQYTVNDTPMTAEQLEAVNSGITADLVNQISTNQSSISGISNSLNSLTETVGDSTNGLVKEVSDNTSRLAENTDAITNLRISTGELAGKVSNNETSIQTIDSNIGTINTEITGIKNGLSTKAYTETQQVVNWEKANGYTSTGSYIFIDNYSRTFTDFENSFKLNNIEISDIRPYKKLSDSKYSVAVYYDKKNVNTESDPKYEYFFFISSEGKSVRAYRDSSGEGLLLEYYILSEVLTKENLERFTIYQAAKYLKTADNHLAPATILYEGPEGNVSNFTDNTSYKYILKDSYNSVGLLLNAGNQKFFNISTEPDKFILPYLNKRDQTGSSSLEFSNSNISVSILGTELTSTETGVIDTTYVPFSEYTFKDCELVNITNESNTLPSSINIINSKVIITSNNLNPLTNGPFVNIPILDNSELHLYTRAVDTNHTFVIGSSETTAHTSKIYLHGYSTLSLQNSDIGLEVVICKDHVGLGNETIGEIITGDYMPAKIIDLRGASVDLPVVYSISDNATSLGRGDIPLQWSTLESGEKSATIEYSNYRGTGHYRGCLRDNLYLPKVKTYASIDSSNTKFEEVYDSAVINISTGEVTIYSNKTPSVYLVVIS